jgi:hypothetical protein
MFNTVQFLSSMRVPGMKQAWCTGSIAFVQNAATGVFRTEIAGEQAGQSW